MVKFIKWKNITEFLKTDYPENLLPTKKLPKRHKKIIQENNRNLKKIKKRIKYIENLILTKKNNEFNHVRKNMVLPTTFTTLSYTRYNLKCKSNEWTSRPIDGKNYSIANNKVSATLENTNRQSVNKNNIIDKGFISHLLFSYDQLKNDILKKQLQYRVFSDFLMKLKEKKKFSILYGNISKKFFEKAYRQSANSRGKINENLLTQFEMRLDVLLYRISFCKNIYTAKQYITHNYVSVNGNILNIPSFQVKAGDVVSIDLAKKTRWINHLLEHLKTKLSKRRFRFLISHQYLQKYIKTSDDFYNTTKKLKGRLKFLISILKKNQAQQKDRYSNFYGSKKKQILSKREQRRVSLHIRSKKFGLLKKINQLNQSLNGILKYQKTENLYLKDKIILKIKRFMRLKRSHQHILSAMRISPMKPLHLEVSYKLLTAIVLFSPQKISFPALLNMHLLSRTLSR